MEKRKKLTAPLLILCLSFIACGNTEPPAGGSSGSSQQGDAGSTPQQVQQQIEESVESDTEKVLTIEQEAEEDQVLVVYFSATGNTKGVANTIASITDADLYEIVPAQPYSDEDLNYGNQDSRASIESNDPDARPEIGGESLSLDGYQIVYLGYPIWWGDAPRIMSTFVESHDFADRTVIPFCTSGGSGIGDSGGHLEEQAQSGNWLDGQRFSAGCSQEEVQAWIDSLKS